MNCHQQQIYSVLTEKNAEGHTWMPEVFHCGNTCARCSFKVNEML